MSALRPKVVHSADCGNSPKNAFVEALTVALILGAWDEVAARVTDDIEWVIVGRDAVQGKDALEAAIANGAGKVRVLRIDRVISHGKGGAVSGIIELATGRTRAFCDVHEFASAAGKRVAHITSYDIAT
jgi:hypothetical protein